MECPLDDSAMIKRSLLVASVLLIGGAVPAQALPQCYMDMGGVLTDLSHMCGDGGGSAPVLSPAVSGGGSTAVLSPSVATAEAELPVLLDKRIDGNLLEFWLRNPRSTPSRLTSAYYQAGYWAGNDYEIVSGYIDIGGNTETRQYLNLNLRDQHPIIPEDVNLDLTELRILSSRYNR